MKLQIDKKKRKNINIIIDGDKTIKDLKDILKYKKKGLLKRIRILPEYLVLKFNEDILDNGAFICDCGFNDDQVIKMSLAIKWHKSECDDNGQINYFTVLIDYDAKVSDLMKIVGGEVNESNVGLMCGRKCKSGHYVRQYLCEENLVFSVIVNKHKESIGAGPNKETRFSNQSDTLKLDMKDVEQVKSILNSKESVSTKLRNDDNNNTLTDMDQMENSKTVHSSEITFVGKRKNISKSMIAIDATDEISTVSTHISQGLRSHSLGYIINLQSALKIDNDTIIINLNDGTTDRVKQNDIIDQSIEGEGADKLKSAAKKVHNEGIFLNVVNNLNGELITDDTFIAVDIESTVDLVRDIISRTYIVEPGSFDIYYLSQILDNGKLNMYGIKNHDSLIVKPRKNDGKNVELFVIKVNSASFDSKDYEEQQYLINEFETVRIIKERICEKNNVNIDCIQLLFEGREIHDEDVFRELRIPNESLLTLRKEGMKDSFINFINITIKMNIDADYDSRVERISIRGDSTVERLRQQLNSLFNIDYLNYVVSYNGELLINESTLYTYNIKDDDEVVISYSLSVWYFNHADNFLVKTNNYPFLWTDRVADLKDRISKKTNIPSHSMLLNYDGNALENDKKLVEYEIENNSLLFMVASLAGGL